MACISVDFDGSLGLDFVISEKIPNRELINQINYLKEAGNYIKIVTARGSYNSTIEERTEKYYHQIKNYLDLNEIKYDEISFVKEFADLYIDDLAIRPDEIVITKDMSSIFTGNIVTRINDTVIKSGSTISNEYEWYKAYDNKEDIPEIINVTRNSLVYKYIQNNNKLDLNILLGKINRYKEYSKLNNLKFNSYIEGIKTHLKNNPIHNSDKLVYSLYKLNIYPTFAHGDLSLYNIIPTDNEIKFIDPLYHKDKFGSYIVDYAKLLFSIKFYKGDVGMFNEIKNIIDLNYIDILIAAECIRVASYRKQFNFIAENLINEL